VKSLLKCWAIVIHLIFTEVVYLTQHYTTEPVNLTQQKKDSGITSITTVSGTGVRRLQFSSHIFGVVVFAQLSVIDIGLTNSVGS
jgi:hypothetical protein